MASYSVTQKHTSSKLDTYQESLWPLLPRVGKAEQGAMLLQAQAHTLTPALLPAQARRRFGDDRAHQGLGLSKNGNSLMEMGTGWMKTRVSEWGELLAWERGCKNIRTEFYSKKMLLTSETSCTGEVQTCCL